MTDNRWHVIEAWDADSGEHHLVLFGSDEIPQRDNVLFIYSHTDPVLGEMVYPLTPPEWNFFNMSLDKFTARYYLGVNLESAQMTYYLGFPALD